MANDLRMRIGVHNLSSDQVDAFREAYRQMMAINDNRGYQFFAGLHGAPNWFCWHHQQNASSALRMQVFLPWHRAYLYNFELAMRDRVKDVSLPWWDWTLGPPRQSGLPPIFTEARDGSKPNPLLRFRIDLPNANPPVNHNTTRSPGDTRQIFPSWGQRSTRCSIRPTGATSPTASRTSTTRCMAGCRATWATSARRRTTRSSGRTTP